MYGIAMKFTVKTLLESGLSQRAIARELCISRKTVKRYVVEFSSSEQVATPTIIKSKKLDTFKSEIQDWFSQGLTGVLIDEKLVKEKGLKVGYATISRFLQRFKTPEVYVPLIAKPAHEAQVDFGYLGRFFKNDKPVKVWCFSMVLSHSRYSYHCLVTDQSVSTFINCHIHAFEYFSGVPYTVKIDNLKAGVITPNFYEPVIQRQYAEFLEYYQSAPITARIRRGQDKGKVEAGVKYVKNNFLKRATTKDYHQLEADLKDWTDHICNKRLHGTTKKIPLQVFTSNEKHLLKPLPDKRYQLLQICQRKVNNYAHISFKNNYYSVPYNYIGQMLTVKSSDSLLKIYQDCQQVALHMISEKQGEYFSKEEHRPPSKQKKTQQEYIQKAITFGSHTHNFLTQLKQDKPWHWLKIMQGVFNLELQYSAQIVDNACKRALEYQVINYASVRNICKNRLYDIPKEATSVPGGSSEFAHDLKKYDQLLNN